MLKACPKTGNVPCLCWIKKNWPWVAAVGAAAALQWVI